MKSRIPAYRRTDRSPDAPAAPTIHEKLLAVQQSPLAAFVRGQLDLGNFETWPLPQTPIGPKIPISHRHGGLNISLCPGCWISRKSECRSNSEGSRPCRVLVIANARGQPKDPLSAYPASVAIRMDVLLRLLAARSSTRNGISRKPGSLLRSPYYMDLPCRDPRPEHLSAIPSSDPHSLCAVCASRYGLPDFPLSTYWRSIALYQLRIGFDSSSRFGWVIE